jgi:hypothetical protein
MNQCHRKAEVPNCRYRIAGLSEHESMCQLAYCQVSVDQLNKSAADVITQVETLTAVMSDVANGLMDLLTRDAPAKPSAIPVPTGNAMLPPAGNELTGHATMATAPLPTMPSPLPTPPAANKAKGKK